MYKVCIYNNEVETIVHYPTASSSAPHLLTLNLKESLSQAEQLFFSVPVNNPGYSLIEGLITKAKVYDTRDDSVVFSGRVIPSKDGMSSDGKFTNQVGCEGALNYLNDTQTRRWALENQTPREIINELLWQHNLKVDDSRKMYCGVFEIIQPITVNTNYETTLNTIISKVKNVLGGDIRVQERDGVLYLDYLLAQGANNGVEIQLRRNLKEIIREYDPTDVVTRGIVLGYGEGINQLDITSVNSGVEYIEDAAAISKYGVIEGLITNKDIQNADTLKIYGQTVLNEKKQPKLSYTQTALDLSVLTGHEDEKYELGDTLHTIVDVMNIDVYSRVIERGRDLLNSPWNPKLVISTRPITLTDQIIDLKQRNLTLENAPQGNTVIFPINVAENADSTHPIMLDLDIPKETININRVYINLHGRKYRAYEKELAAGGGSTQTSASGGGGTQTSSSGGSSSSDIATPPASDYDINNIITVATSPADAISPHYHLLPSNVLDMAYNHTHSFNVDVPNHTHNVDVPNHTHTIEYGIFESTYPMNVRIKINNVDIDVSYGSGTEEINEYDVDITAHVNIGNNKIEISTEQNGRIEAIIYSQIFIQSK